MLAKVVGVVAAVSIFVLYFSVIGHWPVVETLLGFALALAAGIVAWWEVDKRMRRRSRTP